MNTPPYPEGDEVPPEQEERDLVWDFPWLPLAIILFSAWILWRAA
jgi:hypothetical protein